MDDEKDKDEGKGSKRGERIRKQAVFFSHLTQLGVSARYVLV